MIKICCDRCSKLEDKPETLGLDVPVNWTIWSPVHLDSSVGEFVAIGNPKHLCPMCSRDMRRFMETLPRSAEVADR